MCEGPVRSLPHLAIRSATNRIRTLDRPLARRPLRGASRFYELGPERVPRAKVVDMLATVHDPAVRELEDDAGVDVQTSAVPLGDVVLDDDHTTVFVGEHALQVGPKRAARLGRVATE